MILTTEVIRAIGEIGEKYGISCNTIEGFKACAKIYQSQLENK